MNSFRSKHLALACAAGLAMSTGALAQSTGGAFCRAASISNSSAVSQDAYTTAWLDIGNYVCGAQAEEPTVVNINEQVTDVASAIAQAFAEVSANCRARGNAEVRAMGYAFAQDRAEAVGTAITEIFASAEVCGQCTAAVSALSETSKTLVAEAVAKAWTQLYLFSDYGTEVSDESTITSDIVVEVIEEVLSSITGVIRAGADDGCSIEVINSAKVGDFLSTCEAAVSGEFRVVEVDAIAEAGADARAYACGGFFADTSVEVIVQATAKALAQAVAQADIFCETNGGDETMLCGLAEVDVRAVASTQAEAFASALASAEICNCNLSESAEVRVWAGIWVPAVANAYAETCVSGNGEDFVTDFTFAVEERMLIATARAIATAADDASECGDDYSFCSHHSLQCVANNRKCGGSGFGAVLPCCDPDYRCFRRNERSFRCRHRNSRLPSFWDGTIEECTLDLGAH